MEKNHIWELIAKKLSGEAGEEDLLELKLQLRKNPDLHYPLQNIIDLWESTAADLSPQEIRDAFNRHIDRMELMNVDYPQVLPEKGRPSPKTSSGRRYFLIAGLSVFFLLCSILIVGIRYSHNSQPLAGMAPVRNEKAISEIDTKNGSKTNLILPDGTKVWMNAGSSLKYDSTYGKTIREVTLSGEAFFDVVKNKEKPFIIHASRINIKVLGTKFNVKSYPTDKTTEAALIRGSIEVTFKDRPNKKVILKPNEKIVVGNLSSIGSVTEITHSAKAKINEIPDVAVENLTYENKTGTIIETSWVENKLIFQNESFDNIARQLERWYGVSISFKNKQLKDNHLTGSFKNESIRQALDALKFTAPFNYEIDNNNNVTIY